MARIPEGLRVYAVGDVHGRADLLDDCLARIDADRRQRPAPACREIFLGDYLDRGADTAGVIERLIERRARGEAVMLAGNHEDMLAQALDDPSALGLWLANGGTETLASYGIVVPPRVADAGGLVAAMHDRIPEAHRRFLRTLEDSHRCGDYLFVHAGIRPGVPLEAQDRRDLIWIRDEFLRSRRDHGFVVVHGHTPVRDAEFCANRINIDTGAYITGRLTCLVLEGDDARVLDG